MILRIFQKLVVIKGVDFSVTVGTEQVAFFGFRQYPFPGLVPNHAAIQANFFLGWVSVMKLKDTGMKGLLASLTPAPFQGNQLGLSEVPTLSPDLVPSGSLPSFGQFCILRLWGSGN